MITRPSPCPRAKRSAAARGISSLVMPQRDVPKVTQRLTRADQATCDKEKHGPGTLGLLGMLGVLQLHLQHSTPLSSRIPKNLQVQQKKLMMGNVKKWTVQNLGMVFCREIRLWTFQNVHEPPKKSYNLAMQENLVSGWHHYKNTSRPIGRTKNSTHKQPYQTNTMPRRCRIINMYQTPLQNEVPGPMYLKLQNGMPRWKWVLLLFISFHDINECVTHIVSTKWGYRGLRSRKWAHSRFSVKCPLYRVPRLHNSVGPYRPSVQMASNC